MANICESCGKKINSWFEEPLHISPEKLLCYKCAEPINKLFNGLFYTKDKRRFEHFKKEILDKCTELYSDEIINDITDTINKRYNEIEFEEDKENHILEQEIILDKARNHILTTGYDFENYIIKKYLGVISGQSVLGTGFLSEFTASFADFFGVESDFFAEKLENAKNAAIERLKKRSALLGGNAIIGIDFDYITFGNNMIGVVANGTSVFLEEKENISIDNEDVQ